MSNKLTIRRTTNLTFAKTTKKLDFVAMVITASFCTTEEITKVVGRWKGFYLELYSTMHAYVHTYMQL